MLVMMISCMMWAAHAVLTAFHFMMRSAEYLAKLTLGRFDMEKVLRLCDVRFYLKGKRLYSQFWRLVRGKHILCIAPDLVHFHTAIL